MFPCSRKKQWEHFFLRVPTKTTVGTFCKWRQNAMFPCSTYHFRYSVPTSFGNMFPKSRKMFPLRWRQNAMFPLFPLFPRKNRTLQEDKKKKRYRERERERENALRAIYKKKVRTLGTHFVFSL